MKGKLRWMLVLLVLILGASACDDDDDDNNGNGNDNELSQEDRDFMRDAALTNLSEIEMGQLVLDSADSVGSDSTVVAFAERMVNEHTTAWNELSDLADDKDVDLPNEPSQAQQEQMDYLMTLNGYQFDSAYVEYQIAGHQAAVTLFQQAAANSEDDDDVRSYATKYLPHIQEHLTDAMSLRDSIVAQPRIRSRQ
jgi:putative membrane protein